MSDSSQVSADAISALLTGLAGALTDAQVLMSGQPTHDEYGRPMPVYQIPHLDFEFEIETIRQSSQTAAPRRIIVRPATNTHAGDKISSTIRGRLVAVPSTGIPQVQVSIAQSDNGLEIQLINTAGEILANAPIELEFDADASAALYDTTLDASARLALLGAQRVITDAQGRATVTIQRSTIPSGKSAVILIRSGGAIARTTVAREVLP